MSILILLESCSRAQCVSYLLLLFVLCVVGAEILNIRPFVDRAAIVLFAFISAEICRDRDIVDTARLARSPSGGALRWNQVILRLMHLAIHAHLLHAGSSLWHLVVEEGVVELYALCGITYFIAEVVGEFAVCLMKLVVSISSRAFSSRSLRHIWPWLVHALIWLDAWVQAMSLLFSRGHSLGLLLGVVYVWYCLMGRLAGLRVKQTCRNVLVGLERRPVRFHPVVLSYCTMSRIFLRFKAVFHTWVWTDCQHSVFLCLLVRFVRPMMTDQHVGDRYVIYDEMCHDFSNRELKNISLYVLLVNHNNHLKDQLE